ncbi:hypothetical protein QJQ45_028034 [Haematococcus lacustris]|nr:hypothetical protein QJQ45_028034 [Haematococcus lacustris]
MGLYSKSHPHRWKGGHAARCACCIKSTQAGQNLLAIGQVTDQMSEVIMACDNLKPALIPLAHRTCAEAAAAAHAVGQRLQGQEPASQLQPMPRLSSTPTQAPAQPGPAHAPCPHQLPDQPPSHPSQLQGSSQHHPALPALLHLPGLSILTRPATNPVTSPAVEQQPIIHTTEEQDEQTMPPSMPKQQQDWATARKRGSAAGPRDKHTERMGQEVVEVFGRCGSADQQAQLLDRVLTSPQLPPITHESDQQAQLLDRVLTSPQLPPITHECVRPSITKPFVAMPMFDQKRDDKHWDDECLTLLCSFAPDSVMQLCTLGKKLSVKMLNEYCKAVGLCVPANTLRADLRYMVLQHLNEQAECD